MTFQCLPRIVSRVSGLSKALVALTMLVLAEPVAAQVPPPWSFGGGDIYNSHAASSPNGNIGTAIQITPENVRRLRLRWSLITSGAVTATPTVELGGLYVPDGGGMIYKVRPDLGKVLWAHKVSTYTGLRGSMSRSSPAIGPNVIVFGDYWAHDLNQTSNTGARVIAADKATGALVWQTVVDKTSQWSEILGSPVIYGNLVYVGTASWEEGHAKDASYSPTFRGSVVALDLATGKIVWQFFATPKGYTGVAVPGTNPVVWPATNSLIVATGNNYSVPSQVGQCIAAARPNIGQMNACMDPTNYVESILALDLTTGKLQWSRQLGGPDTWNTGCQSSNAQTRAADCPYGPSTDYDFASQPNFMKLPDFVGVPDDRGGTSAELILGAGQKSGIYWALNPANGGLFWSRKIGNGGIEWGSAFNLTTHHAIFVALNNTGHYTNRLAGQNGRSVTWNAGAVASLDIATGNFWWQVPAYGNDLSNPAVGSTAQGAVTSTNRVVFSGSSSGYFTARAAATGDLLWTYNSGSYVAGGPAIFKDAVFWGTGFRTTGTGKPTLFAFDIPAAK